MKKVKQTTGTKTSKKLMLSKETILLTREALTQVAGGWSNWSVTWVDNPGTCNG